MPDTSTNMSKIQKIEEQENKENCESKFNKMEYKHVKHELKKLADKVQENNFNEREKQILEIIFNLLTIDNFNCSTEEYMSSVLELLFELSKTTACFYFKDSFYSLFYIFMRKKLKCSLTLRIKVFKHIRYVSLPERLFTDLYLDYSKLDSTDVYGVSFKNYVLHKLIEKVIISYNDDKNSLDLTKERVLDVLKMFFNTIDDFNVPSFFNYLKTKINEKPIIIFLLAYTHHWLNNIEVDLFALKNLKALNNVNDSFMLKIFEVFSKIYFQVSLESNEQNQSEDLFLIIKDIFKSQKLQNIIFSVYQRLFNYVLINSRKTLSKIEIIRCFDMSQQHAIYTKIKQATFKQGHDIFLNVFKQINVNYVIHEIENTNDIKLFLDILNDTQIKLTNIQYKTVLFYYFKICADSNVIVDMEIVKKYLISVSHAFFELDEFYKLSLSKTPNREYNNNLLYVDIRNVLNNINFDTPYVLHFIAYMYEFVEFDLVELCAIITENEEWLRSKKMYECTKYILIIINNKLSKLKTISNLNNILVDKMVNTFTKNIIYKEHVKRLGKILFSLANNYDSLLHDKIIMILKGTVNPSSRFNLVIYGALGDYVNFEKMFNSNMNEISDNDLFALVLMLSYPKFKKKKEHFEIIKNCLNEIAEGIHGPDSSKNKHRLVLILENIFIEGRNGDSDLFLRNNISLFTRLYLSHDILSVIFMYALKDKLVVPNTVIEYLVINKNYKYLYRNFFNVCLNSIFGSINIIYERIKMELVSYQTINQNADQCINRDVEDNNAVYTIIDKFTKNTENISNLYNYNNNETYKYLVNNMYVVEDKLYVFILMKQIRNISKDDKEKIVEIIERHISNTEIREYMHCIHKEYKKSNRKEIEVEKILGTK
ncbi:hypothetical protein EHP00_518 [Ecytonucleospora hepatopenaei]|uniref:Uncharacterized protein n=1 Tax=Ecytonucleospora hepatopenaei TaxID=646526 RepID=A0A1W0E443_9MICR|nr:hypothetical protein EHP00_518 [Ecytonucleospora hepatopenaei]